MNEFMTVIGLSACIAYVLFPLVIAFHFFKARNTKQPNDKKEWIIHNVLYTASFLLTFSISAYLLNSIIHTPPLVEDLHIVLFALTLCTTVFTTLIMLGIMKRSIDINFKYFKEKQHRTSLK